MPPTYDAGDRRRATSSCSTKAIAMNICRGPSVRRSGGRRRRVRVSVCIARRRSARGVDRAGRIAARSRRVGGVAILDPFGNSVSMRTVCANWFPRRVSWSWLRREASPLAEQADEGPGRPGEEAVHGRRGRGADQQVRRGCEGLHVCVRADEGSRAAVQDRQRASERRRVRLGGAVLPAVPQGRRRRRVEVRHAHERSASRKCGAPVDEAAVITPPTTVVPRRRCHRRPVEPPPPVVDARGRRRSREGQPMPEVEKPEPPPAGDAGRRDQAMPRRRRQAPGDVAVSRSRRRTRRKTEPDPGHARDDRAWVVLAGGAGAPRRRRRRALRARQVGHGGERLQGRRRTRRSRSAAVTAIASVYFTSRTTTRTRPRRARLIVPTADAATAPASRRSFGSRRSSYRRARSARSSRRSRCPTASSAASSGARTRARPRPSARYPLSVADRPCAFITVSNCASNAAQLAGRFTRSNAIAPSST